ncbi:hypothetical protein EVAR_31615_1 [Eumeta japonica]|uniref:CHK kinase-like domain-containing protein n=1 Tax=Eumeta variegata TaxID=151549 RepID=A0A4C1VZB5_EUMVA|nr:hypothetical protein EVAR_31615_1 [Eumeta japonica]
MIGASYCLTRLRVGHREIHVIVTRKPEGMDEISLECLKDLLKRDYPDVEIQSYEEAPGSKRGDNYTSMLYRITLKGERKITEPDGSSETTEPWQESLIYKCLPQNTMRREAFKSDELFCNEVAFYNKIWPALTYFQKRWLDKLSSPFNAIPKCYLAQNNAVILKDLRDLGFTMPDRRQGLTVEQCYYVLKHLAHFHALSLSMKYEDSERFFDLINHRDGISEVFFVPSNEDYYRDYYREVIGNALAMVEQELQVCEAAVQQRYMEKFKKFCSEDIFFSMMMELVAPQEPLAVICHGDCWPNNLLFRYEEDHIAELCFVDFQMARYASPALDLAYLLYLGLSRQQRDEHLSSLLTHYTRELHARLLEMSNEDSIFRTTLSKEILFEMILGLDPSTAARAYRALPMTIFTYRLFGDNSSPKLQDEFRRSGRFGLGIALDMYPIVTCDSNEAPNVYQTEENDVSVEKAVTPVFTTNQACRRKMTDLLQELVDADII